MPLRLRAFAAHLFIFPPIRSRVPLEPFHYHPERSPEKEADLRLAEIRKDLIQQMNAQHLSVVIPSRLRNRQTTHRLARRLYRAAILDPAEWTWRAIAEAERAEGAFCTWRSVRDTVRKWARILGVELPRRRPGHRRRAKP